MIWSSKSLALRAICPVLNERGQDFGLKKSTQQRRYLKLIQSLVKKQVYTKLPTQNIFQIIK